MGEIQPEKCEGRELTKDQLAGGEGRVFKLLTKRGNKQQVKDLVVPDKTSIAVTKSSGEDDGETAERNALKRQVLALDAQAQEEERLAARRQHYQRGGGPPDQRLDPGSRFNAKREVREPRKNKAAEKQNFDDITEKAMKKGTSKGGWKGAEALGIDFEM